MASSSNKDWDADFCCDLAELMVSSEEEEVVSAGVPTELRVSYFSWLWAFNLSVLFMNVMYCKNNPQNNE